jgi:hypothetical protein
MPHRQLVESIFRNSKWRALKNWWKLEPAAVFADLHRPDGRKICLSVAGEISSSEYSRASVELKPITIGKMKESLTEESISVRWDKSLWQEYCHLFFPPGLAAEQRRLCR